MIHVKKNQPASMAEQAGNKKEDAFDNEMKVNILIYAFRYCFYLLRLILDINVSILWQT